MFRLMIIALVFALIYPTYAQQRADYRITETTQACYHRNRVQASVERAKRGVGEFKFGCVPAYKGHEVRLLKQKGDESLVDYCIVDGCTHKWLLSTMLEKIVR